MAVRITKEQFPIWWEPKLIDGADWSFNATCTGLHEGKLVQAVLWLNGQMYTFPIKGNVIYVKVDKGIVSTINRGAAIDLYLDTDGGARLAWLHGTVQKG